MIGRTARDLAADVRNGARTPHEVVAAHLEAIERWDAHLGAFVSVRRDAALAEADALGARPDLDRLPLAGVPVAVKDVADVTGEATRHGSVALPDRPATDDDPTVSRLRAAGAVVVGKTRGPELGLWGTSDGPDGVAVSPWDTSRTAGGSSGGSAAAVAAGLVPVALGSDGLGSVRIPAAACGLFGIKPGGGLVPVVVDRRGVHWFGMSQYGALATTVADAALFLDVIAASAHYRDPAPPDRRLRVAVSVRSPAAGLPVAGSWRDAALEAGRVLRVGGHDVRVADPPYGTARTAAALLGRWLQGAAQDVDTLGADEERLQARTRGHVAVGRALGRVAPVREEGARRLQASVAAFFADHDVLITPTFARSALPAVAWHRRGWAANVAANLSAYPFTGPWNLADCPAAAVPMGLADGRPLSVQVVAAEGREDLVLAVARQLEQARPWTRHAPGWAVVH